MKVYQAVSVLTEEVAGVKRAARPEAYRQSASSGGSQVTQPDGIRFPLTSVELQGLEAGLVHKVSRAVVC